jgi:ABC-type sugar transport system substrate-binding protein
MQMRTLSMAMTLTALAGVTGCGPAVQSTPFAVLSPQSTDRPVAIYSTKSPECAYEEVGLVSARQRSSWFNSMTDVLDALKERARAMGGDAVIQVSEGREVSGGGSNGGNVSSDAVLSGTVIRFTEADCTR